MHSSSPKLSSCRFSGDIDLRRVSVLRKLGRLGRVTCFSTKARSAAFPLSQDSIPGLSMIRSKPLERFPAIVVRGGQSHDWPKAFLIRYEETSMSEALENHRSKAETHKTMGGKVNIYRRKNSNNWQCSTFLSGRNWRVSTHKISPSGIYEIGSKHFHSSHRPAQLTYTPCNVK